MSWSVSKSFRFEAAHHLPHHDGKCRNPHGHSYRLIVELCDWQLYDEGPKQGMIFDYADISSFVKPMIEEYLDHKDLNQTLEIPNTTAEEIARWVFWKLKAKFRELRSVTIEETDSTSATYFEGTEAERGFEWINRGAREERLKNGD